MKRQLRVAWFAPQPHEVLQALGKLDLIDHVDARRAHDFVWQHFRTPYDLTVFELGDTAAHTFMWPYLFRYPGALVLRATSLQHSRSESLTFQRRHHHLRAERAFSGWSLLRAPLTASRLVVVHDASLAPELQEAVPDLRIRVVPAAAAPIAVTTVDGPVRFHVASGGYETVHRAATRAREGGSQVVIVGPPDDVRKNDVVIALEWPPSCAPPIDALRAMAAGLPVIVFETQAVATWPTLDPQTWQRRGYAGHEPPIAISIDPRDEEHSLMLAMRRLATDIGLRVALGTAARAWARDHASLESAVDAWRPVLQEAAHAAPLRGAADLPAHLIADGTERARRVLAEFGSTVDFLES